MEYALTKRTLGRTGIRVSPIGIGTGSLAADPAVTDPDAIDELAVATLRTAFQAGLNYIDTAPGYRGGDSDRRVGMALREVPRDQVVLATKVGSHPARPGDVTGETATWIIEESLAVMGTGHIDIALVHDPSTMGPVLEKGGAVAALERLKEEGTVRAIGLGVQNHEYLRIGIESGRFDVIQSPYDYNLLRTTAEDLIDLATERELGFINAAPFLAGLLSGVDPHKIVDIRAATGMWALRDRDVQRARRIWDWAADRGIDLRSLAMQFCLREQRVATTLIGPRRPSEVAEGIAAATKPVSEADWAALAEALPAFPAAAPGGEAAVGPYPPND